MMCHIQLSLPPSFIIYMYYIMGINSCSYYVKIHVHVAAAVYPLGLLDAANDFTRVRECEQCLLIGLS